MINISGNGKRYCDGVSRRTFLRIGGLAMGGLALPQILRAEAAAAAAGKSVPRGKSVIMVYLPGGPPHQDSVDLKMEAPSEIRGPFKPIKTKAPGVQVCELLPKIAACADKLAIVRSLTGLRDEHASWQVSTGYSISERKVGHPHFGSIVSALKGPTDPGVPPFVDLFPRMQHTPYNSPPTGFLGPAHAGFAPDGPGRADMTLDGVTADRLGDRKTLLAAVDGLRREMDNNRQIEAMDAFTARAMDVLAGSRLADALNVEAESPKVRARYGKGNDKHAGDGGPFQNEHLLVARRLVEAGVRVVTVAFGFWDFHGGNFKNCEQSLPKLDQAVSALVEDIHDRGLDKDVSVVVWGEFGRSPRVNKDQGRDHWPSASFALLAGGGMKVGQVIGSTNRNGEVPADRPIHYQQVLATIYHNLGIDLETTLPDLFGRPMYLLDNREPIRELI